MKNFKTGVFGLMLGAMLGVLSAPALPDDIDLFTNSAKGSNGSASNPNILFVLDNTSNWSRNDQKYPDPDDPTKTIDQGQAEVRAIKIALQALGANAASINVGLMEFPAAGSGTNANGGYIRYAIRPMTSSNLPSFTALLDRIYDNIRNSKQERQSANLAYGNYISDVYHYFTGGVPTAQSSDVANTGNADSAGYVTNYTRFRAPDGGSCGHNYIVFIGNPNANGPGTDSDANTAALAALGGSTTQPPVPLFGAGNVATDLGLATQCYAQSAAGVNACTTAETTGSGSYVSQCSAYGNCACDSTAANASTGLTSCPTNTQRYSVLGTKNTSTSTNSSTPPGPVVSGPTTTDTGTNLGCTADTSTTSKSTTTTMTTPNTVFASVCQKSAPTVSCPVNTTSTIAGPGTNQTTTTTTSWASCTAQNTGTSCASSGGKVTWNSVGTKTDASYTTTTTYTANPPAAVCPSTTTATSAGPASNQTTTTTTSWTNCTANPSTAIACAANQHDFELFGSKTVNAYTTTTTTSSTVTNLGNTFACYASQSSCSTSDYGSQASSYNGGLACGTPTTTTGICPNGGIRYNVQGINQGSAPTGTTGIIDPKSLPLNANLWTQFMYQTGIASTYTIDVYHAAPNNVESTLYNSMASLGGGKYYAAQNQASIVSALADILDEIQSVNSNFASAALPVSATNRAQNVNQVFIGMFRPDQDANPRWYGNLKRYQLIRSNTGTIDLGDANGEEAINNQTGFIGNCATSFWTSDSGVYWQSVAGDKPLPRGVCPTTNFSPFSDSPDGPFVEKGATAEAVRKGNGTAGTPPTVNRNVLTLTNGSLAPFTTSNAPGLSQSLVDFINGQDVNDENANSNRTEPRPSIHGDVIHSRPLPINYGSGTTPIVVYYGANDGTFRAVDAATGKELWAFVAPETFGRLNRLMTNSPPDLLYGGSTNRTPVPTPKDYFFDGSTGVFQLADNSKVMIYPTMHRGGRMIYAFDVTNPASPVYKWRAGCPNLTDDTGCTTDGFGSSMSDIGQTWSLPNVAQIKGYTVSGKTAPVIIMGGGYDACQDANTGSPSCGSAKGNVVYVLDATDGHVIRKFATTGGVAADVSLVDANNDGLVDYAYAADMSGNIWRINFSKIDGTALQSSSWEITKVAYTTGAGRKFLYGPAVLAAGQNTTYLALGSGDREHPLISQYPYPGAVTANGIQNRFYVYLDQLSRTTAVDLDSATTSTSVNGATCTDSQLLPGSTRSSWHLDLGAGEQVVTSAIIAAGLVAFSTNTPTDPVAGACSSLGNAQGYLVNLFNGSGSIGVPGACGGRISSTFVGGGLPPSPVLATVPVGDTVQTVVLGVAQKDGSVSSTLQSQTLNPTINNVRKGVFWRRSGDN